MKRAKVLVIIPAYNEQDNILNTVRAIKKTKFDYVVINDGSIDKTRQILIDNNINHIDLPFNMGIGCAVQTGYMYAKKYDYDIAVQFDGDGQHDENYIENIIRPICNNEADMVVGSRFVDNISKFKSTFARKIGIKLISVIIKVLTRKEIKDVTSGFRAIDKALIEFFSKNYPNEYPEPVTNYALLKAKYKVKEVGVNMKERVGGKSSRRPIKSL